MNLWPPFVGARIHVTRIADDFREVEVTMKLGLSNRNYFGTHFGGSLYAMTDPFYALMMLNNLGPEYVVWDRAGAIRYDAPARGQVWARFRITAADIARARKATASGDKYEPTFRATIVDRDGRKLAHVERTLYIRRRAAASS